MHKVGPKVFLIGESQIVENGLQAYLDHIGVPDWTSDAPTDAEKIIEVMRSFSKYTDYCVINSCALTIPPCPWVLLNIFEKFISFFIRLWPQRNP